MWMLRIELEESVIIGKARSLWIIGFSIHHLSVSVDGHRQFTEVQQDPPSPTLVVLSLGITLESHLRFGGRERAPVTHSRPVRLRIFGADPDMGTFKCALLAMDGHGAEPERLTLRCASTPHSGIVRKTDLCWPGDVVW